MRSAVFQEKLKNGFFIFLGKMIFLNEYVFFFFITSIWIMFFIDSTLTRQRSPGYFFVTFVL